MSKIDRPVIPVAQIEDKLVLDADMEEPKCDRCDHLNSDSYCEHCDDCWRFYQRTTTWDAELREMFSPKELEDDK